MGNQPPTTAAAASPVRMPTGRASVFDPPPALAALAADGAPRRLHYADGEVGWLVTAHEQARRLVGDRGLAVVMVQPLGDPAAHATFDEAIGGLDDGFVSLKQPPDHTRLRRAVAARFTPGRVAERRARIAAIVDELLTEVERAGPPVDLRSAFALAVPSRVICELLGVPARDEQRFLHPTEVMLDAAATPERMADAFRAFGDYVREVVARKHAEPGDDLLTDLARSGELDDDELAGMAMELFITGHETTANAIALGTLALLRDGDAWAALAADPTLIEGWSEELLRYLSIVEQSFTRVATADVALDGLTIRAGERVTVSLLTANRDGARFPDPDRLRLDRDAHGHLAFGHGIHKCLGQHLARVELQAALAGLAARFPTLRLAAPVERLPLESAEVGVYRALALPVSW
ncbi:cytochrome P450 [Patulibacter defluvii]|uniref:cytochrome P450 n=1 Tax=Patulibacter defluvii TaxID=3095358 RepID=UPI002A75BD0B|nr:cytochrome P450 [Patulibacter sp. DM4]